MEAAVVQGKALADFDQHRSTYLEALAGAPDGSLRYLKEGEDYALGGIPFHVNAVLEHYFGVLDAVVTSGFGPVEPADPPGLFERANAAARTGLTPEQRGPVLEAGEQLHRRVHTLAAGLSPEDFVRKAPVRFEPGADPLPTSAQDVLGWLTGHYQEHVPQIHQLLAEWRSVGRE